MKPSSFVQDFLRRVRALPPDALAVRPLPQASLSHGHAGVAFFLAEHFRVTFDLTSLARARDHCNAALRVAEASPGHAFGFAGEVPIELRDLVAGVFSGWAGVAYVVMLVGTASGDARFVARGEGILADSFRSHLRLPARRSELFFGTAGYVAMVNDLERRGIRSPAAANVGDEAEAILVDDLARPLPRGASLGAAHGRAGELLALVRRTSSNAERVRSSLDELQKLASRAQGCLLWPASKGATVPGRLWSSFCNGVVGQALLFDEASRAYGDARYARTASSAIESLRHLEAPPIATLCCGHAGQAVALQRHGKLASSPPDLRRSRTRLGRALKATGTLDALSLFQGQLGLAFLAMLAESRRPLFVPMFFEP